MEFLDFLKYGAIGISLALAILSYRLLSKEQDKTEVRKPILNTIKLYFFFALLLSVFFGVLEVMSPGKKESSRVLAHSVERIWKHGFSNYPDSTFEQKLQRIATAEFPLRCDTADVCREVYAELLSCKRELDKYKKGFYQNVVNLQNCLNDDPDGWINLAYQIEAKRDVVAALRGIFVCLDGGACDDLTDAQVVEKWRQMKSKWASSKHDYVFKSDVTYIVKEFIATFYGE